MAADVLMAFLLANTLLVVVGRLVLNVQSWIHALRRHSAEEAHGELLNA